MDKLKLHSLDGVARNIDQIGQLFPNAVTEVVRDGKTEKAIDFDVLRQELSGAVVEGREERYQFTWPDKKKAILAANAPISATLRPIVADSVGKDGTPGGFDSENLYIEGDNLDVLKLLQETYLGKIKMIYIDPPYNTGNDFIYNDDFAESSAEYLANSGQYDEQGNQLVNNPESNGRYHTDWLNMIYPRLKLAKSLLADDGLIFISIDENEIVNLRRICDEVFGAGQFIAQVTLLCNPKGRSQDKYVANCHEYVLIFSKNPLPGGGVSIPKTIAEISQDYPLFDAEGKPYRELELRNTHRDFGKFNRKNLWYPLYVRKDGTVSLEEDRDTVAVYPTWDDGFEGCWTWGRDKAAENIQLLIGKNVSGKTKIYRKAYAYAEDVAPLKQVKSIWNDNAFFTEKGQAAVNALFGNRNKLFQAPKSVEMIKQCILMAQERNAIVLDFFSGSSSTAHAVMQLNAEDGGRRKFIMVQLPEPCDETSEAYKAGYRSICDIGKERIRRAGRKIKEEAGLAGQDLDIGFRCLRLDESNMKKAYYTPAETNQSMFDILADNIKEDRTPQDLLFQVMLDLGISLSAKITETQIAGKTVFDVADGNLLACFDKNVTSETVEAIAKRQPYYAVFRDSSMADDNVATNFDRIFDTYSRDTVRKVL
jgi:adenine-specific DNA-methyltransferase